MMWQKIFCEVSVKLSANYPIVTWAWAGRETREAELTGDARTGGRGEAHWCRGYKRPRSCLASAMTSCPQINCHRNTHKIKNSKG